MRSRHFMVFSLALAMAALFMLTACGASQSEIKPQTQEPEKRTETALTDAGKTDSAESAPQKTPESPKAESAETVPTDAAESAPAGKGVLVVYFSATGTTRGVAEKIASITEANLYEITAVQAYTSDDLNWHDNKSRTTLEQNDKHVRPEIDGEPVSLEGYTTIYIGYPIWWGEEPRIMDTFVESYDFDGITVIPFCTSSSSGIGRSGQNLAENAGSGNWLDGKRFGGSVPESDLQSWIEGLN